MRRFTSIKNTIFMARGVFPNSEIIPFKGDLYPIPNGKGICGINNNGGKWLKFKGDTEVIDQIGDYTGTIKKDNCITKDLNGYGGCILDTAINYTLWAYGFWVGKNSKFQYTDGINTYTYQNGVLTSTVASSTPLSLTQLPFETGENYYHILFDLTGKAVDVINEYMTVNACLFHVDNMAEDANFLYHRWLLDEGINSDSPIAIDSGSVADADKVNGTLFYDDTTKPDASIRNTTLYPKHLLNRLNKDGWSKAASLTKATNGYIIYPTFDLHLDEPFTISFKAYSTKQATLLQNNATSSVYFLWFNKLFFKLWIRVNGGAYKYIPFTIADNLDIQIIGNGTTITVTNNYDGETGAFNVADFGANPICTLDRAFGGGSPSYTVEGFVSYFSIEQPTQGISIIDELNGSTIGTPTNIDFNKINIPQNAANKGYDVFGRKLLNKGRVKFNGKVSGGVIASGNGTDSSVNDIIYPTADLEVVIIGKFNSTAGTQRMGSYGVDSRYYWGIAGNNWIFIYGDGVFSGSPHADANIHTFKTNSNGLYIDGVLVIDTSGASYTGTNPNYYSLFARNNGTVDFCDFDLHYASFSVGGIKIKEFYGNNMINILDGIQANLVNISFKKISTIPIGTKDSLSKTVYKDVAGNLIINPQYPATTETVLSGKGWKGIGDINSDPQNWDTYYSFKDNSVIDPSFNDNTKWTGTNWVISGGVATHSTTDLDNLTSTTANPAVIGVSYRVVFDATGISTVDYGGNSYNTSGEIHTASSTADLEIWSNGDGDTISLVKIQEAVEHIDAPNRSGNLVVNGDFKNWGYSDYPDNWSLHGGDANNYFEENADGLHIVFNGSTSTYLQQTVGARNSIKIIKIKVKSITGEFVISPDESYHKEIIDNIGEYIFTITPFLNSRARILIQNNASSCDAVLEYYEEYELEQTNAIGFLPHLIDCLGCYINNNLGLPFILPEALYTLGYIDFSDLYKWSPEAFQYAIDHPEEWGADYQGYVYNHFKNGVLANRVCYANKRTQVENDKIVSKKYLPNYTL